MQSETLERKKPDGEDSAMLRKTRDLLEQTLEDARTLSFEISPPVLYELGLGQAIEWLAEQMGKQHNLRVETIDDGETETLSPDRRAILFRAVRELLFNVVKHAKARSATVTLSREEESVRIDVEDDGVGFDVDELRSGSEGRQGFGLLNIRERVEYLGGTFQCRLGRNGGLWVTLSIPSAAGEETSDE